MYGKTEIIEFRQSHGQFKYVYEKNTISLDTGKQENVAMGAVDSFTVSVLPVKEELGSALRVSWCKYIGGLMIKKRA